MVAIVFGVWVHGDLHVCVRNRVLQYKVADRERDFDYFILWIHVHHEHAGVFDDGKVFVDS